MVNLESHFLYFFEKKIFFLSFNFFQGFCRKNRTFLFFTGFSFLKFLFCCCPAELESVEIFEIPVSLSILELCHKHYFLFFENNS